MPRDRRISGWFFNLPNTACHLSFNGNSLPRVPRVAPDLKRVSILLWVAGGRVATITVTFFNTDEGATGPSHLGTGDDAIPNHRRFVGRARITAYSEVSAADSAQSRSLRSGRAQN